MEAISYRMYWTHDIYKSILKKSDKNLREIEDRIDCLQRSQVYVHNQITKVERSLDELKSLILHRLTDAESVVQMPEVN